MLMPPHYITSVRDNALSSWLPNAEWHQAKLRKRHIGFMGYLLNGISITC
jgi:hypothetical protein